MVLGPDLQTAGGAPRYDIGNDRTPMKIALWIVNGAANKEEEIRGMMRGTNVNCEIITDIRLRPGQILIVHAKHYAQTTCPDQVDRQEDWRYSSHRI